jgi:hypothetical protein
LGRRLGARRFSVRRGREATRPALSSRIDDEPDGDAERESDDEPLEPDGDAERVGVGQTAGVSD